MASRLTRPLIRGAIAVIVLLVLRVILPRLLPPAAGQTASFITVFLAILMAYIFLRHRGLPQSCSAGECLSGFYGVIETIIIAGMYWAWSVWFPPWLQLGFPNWFFFTCCSPRPSPSSYGAISHRACTL